MHRIYPIGGFRETVDEATGQYRTTRDIVRPYDDRPDIDVEPLRPWDSDWNRLALRDRLDGIESVTAIAYSWGGGWGAQRLARALDELGIPVELMLLCDPVFRPLFLPSWGPANVFGFRALIPCSAKIRVPSNVRHIDGVRQNRTLPQGHPLEWGGVTYALKLIDSTHTTIDDSDAWRSCVRNGLEAVFGPPH